MEVVGLGAKAHNHPRKMQIHHEKLPEITRYLEAQGNKLEDKEEQFRNYLRLIGKAHPVDASTRILEVGTGTGWFPLLCKLRGLSCKGLEISPQLVESAFAIGKAYGIEPDIELGNIEDTDIGIEKYDVIVAACVFEHVERWRSGLEKLCAALKPGGVLLFISTNKFFVGHNEYPWKFYGWLPNRLRYRFRIWKVGPEVMKLGIDFNQFRHSQLKKAFRKAGFRKIMDRIDITSPEDVSSPLKRKVLTVCKSLGPAGKLALIFADATLFVCVK
jgi:2-polyprenyl-3-methyl-5-hydroxy-6-metoxy-1,4-benzoquinol methylase